MSLRVKLFTAFVGFIILPLLVLGIVAYQIASNMTEERYSQHTELTLRALVHSVDFVFAEMNKVTDSTIASRAIQEALSNTQGSEEIHEIDYLELNEVQRNFRELLVNHPSVSFAFMYTLYNEKINTLFTKGSFTAMPFETFKQQPIYAKVLERRGLPVWVGPFEYPELTGSEPVFTQIRVVKDIETLRDKGILLVQIKNSGIDAIFRYFRFNQEQYETQFFIVNKDGLILYDSGDRLLGQNLNELASNIHWEGSYRSDRMMFEGQDTILSSIDLGNDEKWRLVSVTSWSSLAGEMALFAGGIAGIILFCLLLACAFILFFANRIAKSIVQTVRVMSEVERGNLKARVPVSGNDETSLLSRGFNSLVHRLEGLLEEVKQQHERKMEAEMTALQAQIKPHFLFNALESINVLAIQNQGRKVSQMVARLGNILRISIQQKEEITVEQELEHLRSYLEIQKFRFEELFNYDIEIPPQLMSCKILKLTLQPLVENSIQHGFEGIEYMGHIRVWAEEEEERVVFYIEDNGIGMAAEQLAKFKYMQEMLPSHRNNPETGERRGLGVSNVADRLRIRYGTSYGLFICSQAGQGTKIKFVIPKYTGSEQYEAEGAFDRR